MIAYDRIRIQAFSKIKLK